MKVDIPYVFLYSTTNSLILNLVRSRFNEEGIEYKIFGQETAGVYPIPFMEARIMVHDDDYAKAKLLLERIKESLETPNVDFDHSNSTLEDIEYEKQVTESEGKYGNSGVAYFIITLIIVLLIYLFISMSL